MEFISHTIAWCKGEIFEGRMVFLFGLVVFALSIIYWKTGSTPFFIPLLVVGVLCMAGGLTMNFSNQKRITAYQKAYSENPQQFVESEKARTEGFIKWYPYTMYGMSLLIVAGICLFLPTPRGRAIGLSLILLGFAALFLDHFSEERAGVYHQHILSYLK